MSLRRLFLQQAQAVSTDFIMEIKTDNAGGTLDTQFNFNAVGTYDINWGDGTSQTGVVNFQAHTYSVAGTYDLSVSGGLENIVFNNGGDKLKALNVKQWGNISWVTFSRAFWGCSNLLLTATDSPDLSGVTDFFRAFRDCDLFDANLGSWDISGITNFSQFMTGATGLSNANYDATLIGWAAQSVQSGISIDFGGSQYTLGGAAEAARTTLTTTYNWTIADGGGI